MWASLGRERALEIKVDPGDRHLRVLQPLCSLQSADQLEEPGQAVPKAMALA